MAYFRGEQYMKTIIKGALLALSLVTGIEQFAMQAPDARLAQRPVAPLNANLLRYYCDEQERLSRELKNIKSSKAAPFTIIGLMGLGAVCVKFIPRMFDRSIESWKSRFLLPAAYVMLFLSGWRICNRLLNQFLINRLPSVVRLRQEKHDFEQGIIDRLRQTNFPYDVFYQDMLNAAGRQERRSSRFSLQLQHEITRRRLFAINPQEENRDHACQELAQAPVQVAAAPNGAVAAAAPAAEVGIHGPYVDRFA